MKNASNYPLITLFPVQNVRLTTVLCVYAFDHNSFIHFQVNRQEQEVISWFVKSYFIVWALTFCFITDSCLGEHSKCVFWFATSHTYAAVNVIFSEKLGTCSSVIEFCWAYSLLTFLPLPRLNFFWSTSQTPFYDIWEFHSISRQEKNQKNMNLTAVILVNTVLLIFSIVRFPDGLFFFF